MSNTVNNMASVMSYSSNLHLQNTIVHGNVTSTLVEPANVLHLELMSAPARSSSLIMLT